MASGAKHSTYSLAAEVRSDSGVLGFILSTCLAGSGVASIDLFGQRGRLFCDFMKSGEIRKSLAGGDGWKPVATRSSSGFGDETARFPRAVEGRGKLSCPPADAVPRQGVLDSI